MSSTAAGQKLNTALKKHMIWTRLPIFHSMTYCLWSTLIGAQKASANSSVYCATKKWLQSEVVPQSLWSSNRTAGWWIPSSATVSHKHNCPSRARAMSCCYSGGSVMGYVCLAIIPKSHELRQWWQWENRPLYLCLCLNKAWSIYSP